MIVLWTVVILVALFLYIHFLVKPAMRKLYADRREMRDTVDSWVKQLEDKQAELDAFNKKVTANTLDAALDEMLAEIIGNPAEKQQYIITEEEELWM